MTLTQQHYAGTTLTFANGGGVLPLSQAQQAVGLELTPSVTISMPDRLLYVDTARPYSYAGYAGRIVRMDYGPSLDSEPVLTSASVVDVHASWPNRANLSYS